jgi:arsenate reductase
LEASTKTRSGGPLWLGEVVATFGLLVVIFGLVRSGRGRITPFAVGAYIGGAYFFTSSTSFANPAVTIGRTTTDTFSGIKPTSAPAFIAAQLVGASLAIAVIWLLYPHIADSAADGVVVSRRTRPPSSTASSRPASGPSTKDQGAIVTDQPIVLFLCIHNSGRSAAARVLLDHYAHGTVEVLSAGSEPGDRINPAVAQILAERGLDPSKEFPKPITDEMARAADVIVTMGCGDACPVFPGKRYLDWELTDPAGLPVERVRPIVDEIDCRVQALLAELVAGLA